MKRLLVAFLFASALAASASAQTTPFGAGTNSAPCNVAGAKPCELPMPQAIGGPVGSPTYVMPPSGGVIDIGQALGPALQPYVDSIAQALIAALVSWVLLVVKNKFNVSIDEGHRDALITALQNQAGSLIADGFVKVEANGKVNVPNAQLAEAANEVMAVIPDAAKRLGFTPDYVAKRIVDTIPQTAAGAAMVAAVQPAAPAKVA